MIAVCMAVPAFPVWICPFSEAEVYLKFLKINELTTIGYTSDILKNMRRVTNLQIILVCCGSLCLPACNPDPIGKTYPVQGKVYRDGELLKAGSVAFFPVDDGTGAPAFEAGARIKPDGTYELYTRGKPGALLGTYKVTVVSQSKADPSKPGDVESLVPKEYTNKDTTPLRVDVVEKLEDGKYDLQLNSKEK